MHEYEMKCSPKKKILTQFFRNSDFKQSPPFLKQQKQFYIKLKVFFKRGWSDHKHTQLHVQSLAKNNLCCVCN